MCGVVAATADRNIVPVLIEGLKNEYRGLLFRWPGRQWYGPN